MAPKRQAFVDKQFNKAKRNLNVMGWAVAKTAIMIFGILVAVLIAKYAPVIFEQMIEYWFVWLLLFIALCIPVYAQIFKEKKYAKRKTRRR